MTITLDFSDKTVVVIGGTSGINRGIAERFARAGARVAVASRSQDKVDDTVAALTAAGAEKAMGLAFDVRDPEAVAAGLAAIQAAFGAFDVLISGAAGNFPALAADMSVNAFKTVIDIDLMGTIHVMKAAYPFLRRPGASVINISAPQAFLPYEGQAHVCAAKAGVDMITRTLSLEWSPEGIRINSVVPGYIADTEGARRLAPTEKALEMVRRNIPQGRLGNTQDVANACLFLGSELASYVSGQVISVDGALYQRGSGQLGQMIGQMLRNPPRTDT
ncbi:SDR family oxidoreductase [Aestuariivita sp.]|jgi:NAD(P)-dependent dehydrogenase (short-subunit alcohol dehydrogenase family)|uniref:SDR family oxidoreductase n=1 Tax=Aestuariivita sp. TaxID=1872407 RepID=UPI002170B392|nr:SDR family oxidoreductase [Aestuariivita sp.]MCE8007461.1 SDR family oxidoreductase [Aestuariivita sp.]